MESAVKIEIMSNEFQSNNRRKQHCFCAWLTDGLIIFPGLSFVSLFHQSQSRGRPKTTAAAAVWPTFLGSIPSSRSWHWLFKVWSGCHGYGPTKKALVSGTQWFQTFTVQWISDLRSDIQNGLMIISEKTFHPEPMFVSSTPWCCRRGRRRFDLIHDDPSSSSAAISLLFFVLCLLAAFLWSFPRWRRRQCRIHRG